MAEIHKIIIDSDTAGDDAAAIILAAKSPTVKILGVTVAAGNVSLEQAALNSMAARKVRGAKHALHLAQNAGVVSSVFNDIVGDSIGIITGVCGAALAYQLASTLSGWAAIAISVAVSSVIAALTIGGKAAMKQVALRHSTPIVLGLGKVLAVFRKEHRR